jgi:hypothetical protein
MKTGIELIAEERQRQIEVEGFTSQHDDKHSNGELANAAAVYAIDPMGGDASNMVQTLWPWDKSWLKISCNENTEDNPVGRIRDLQKAGALIAAEIDRLQRL